MYNFSVPPGNEKRGKEREKEETIKRQKEEQIEEVFAVKREIAGEFKYFSFKEMECWEHYPPLVFFVLGIEFSDWNMEPMLLFNECWLSKQEN